MVAIKALLGGLLLASQALARKIHVNKDSFIQEIKDHRTALDTNTTSFSFWSSPLSTTYLVATNNDTSLEGALGYVLSFDRSDEAIQHSFVPIKETNVTSMGFPMFWKHMEEDDCDGGDDEDEEQPAGTSITITIILDGVDPASADSNQFVYLGLQDQDEIITETVVETIRSTTTITLKKALSTAVAAYNGTMNTHDGSVTDSTISTISQTFTWGFDVNNDTITRDYFNESESSGGIYSAIETDIEDRAPPTLNHEFEKSIFAAAVFVLSAIMIA